LTTDRDIKKDYEEAYNAGQAHWSSYWEEARRDVQFKNGKQYTDKDEAYLKSQDREALVFNKAHRIINVITGYEMKNLLALRIEPFEGADERTASQLSGIVMNAMMSYGGYAAMSGAFEFGSCIAGMNLIESWVDRSDDLLNGDIRFRRLPYNRFVLDPTFTDRDLDRDCNYMITRDFFSQDQCAGLLPERDSDIMRLKGGFSDSKFPFFYPLKGKHNEYNLKYDRFYTKTYRPYRILADTVTGKLVPMPGKGDRRVDEIIRLFMQRFPNLKMLKGRRQGVDLHIFVEGELMYSGIDSTGLDEYPFVLEAGYWTPEDDDPKYRLQGVVRCMRDPGTEVNRRRSQLIDMLDGVIRQGWKVKSGKVVNEDELYNSGFSVVWMDQNAEMTDAEQLQAPAIPAGIFQAMQVLDSDHDSIAGVNSEMLGSPEDKDIEVAAVLAKLRSANGLTTLQSLFAHHRGAKSLLGRKQVRIIQKNYTPAKVARILGEPPTKEFYTKDFGKYDCVPTEGVLTDTQRQQHYAQIVAWKKAGAPIPWEHIIDYAPMERKDKLKEAVQKAEQAAAKQATDLQQMEALTKALMNAERQYTIASAHEKLAKAAEDKSAAALDRAKTITELNTVDLDNFAKTLGLLQSVLAMITGETPGMDQGQAPGPQQPRQIAGSPQLGNMPPMGRA